jgi:hypothetical protein
MSSAEPLEVPSRLRLYTLKCAKPTESGLLFVRDGGPFVLPWHRVQYAYAARVGEGTEERIAFRVVLSQRSSSCETACFDFPADAVSDAGTCARALLVALGPDACDSALRTLAEQGVLSRHHIEAEVFDEAVLEATRWTAS